MRPERSGWRNEVISRWHRTASPDCPAVDLDFVLLEYDHACPSAVIEYKAYHEQEAPDLAHPFPDLSHPNFQAISRLCDPGRVPFFLTFYNQDCSEFVVFPVNETARNRIKGRRTYTGEAYRLFLLWLRHR